VARRVWALIAIVIAAGLAVVALFLLQLWRA